MYDRATRMVFATVALSALAVLLTGPANAYLAEGDGVSPVSAQSQQRQQSQVSGPGAIPYLSHGTGVDTSLFAGQSSRQVTSQPAQPGPIPYLSQGIGVDTSLFAGQSSRQVTSQPQVSRASIGLDPAIKTAIGARAGLSGVHAALQSRHETAPVAPLPHGIQVVLSPPSEEPQSLGLTGDSALTRTAPAAEPLGLTGDSAATRYLQPVSTPATPTVSSGNDFDWASFGAGAGMVALLAAVLGGALLTARRRHSVGLP